MVKPKEKKELVLDFSFGEVSLSCKSQPNPLSLWSFRAFRYECSPISRDPVWLSCIYRSSADGSHVNTSDLSEQNFFIFSSHALLPTLLHNCLSRVQYRKSQCCRLSVYSSKGRLPITSIGSGSSSFYTRSICQKRQRVTVLPLFSQPDWSRTHLQNSGPVGKKTRTRGV